MPVTLGAMTATLVRCEGNYVLTVATVVSRNALEVMTVTGLRSAKTAFGECAESDVYVWDIEPCGLLVVDRRF